MKFVSAVMATVFLLCGGAIAQEKKPMYSVSAGAAFPSQPGQLNDYWHGGWHVGCGIGYPLTSHLTLGGAFSYSRLSFDPEAVIARSSWFEYYPWMEVSGTAATLITGNWRLKINLVPVTRQAWFSPYFFGGLGWFRLTRGEYTIRYRIVSEQSLRTAKSIDRPSSQTGLEVGAGVEFYLSKHWNIYGEITYCSSLDNSPIWAEWVPLRVGLIFH